jgi:uncharacterized membrane protein
MKQEQSARKKKRQENSPPLSHAMMHNIRTIINIRQNAIRERGLQGWIADAITGFAGRMVFVYIHIAWFGAWILLNSGRFGIPPFDPFPHGLLTMIVSLEAIFLSTFVLISQKRMSEDDQRRADLDLQMNLLGEHELTRVLMMLDRIEDKLGIENDSDSELAELEKEIKPEDVLAEIERLQKMAHERNNPLVDILEPKKRKELK